MQEINEQMKINVEVLKSLLLKRKIIRTRFKLPITEDQTIDALTASFQAEVEYRHQTYKESDAVKESIKQAAKWLTEQDKFGLLMCGVPGNGKTTLMRAIQNLINYFNLKDDYGTSIGVSLRDVKDITRLNKDDYNGFVKFRNTPMLAIDDLGLEPTEVLDYGNVLNPIIDLLSYRYNEQLFTIITTNLTGKQIREKYGDRIADRFNEMMRVIIFQDQSYRGKTK